jgi:hypothetical protein
MANTITSDLTISTAVTVLEELLAPIGSFTRNITNEVQPRRQTSVDVPIIKKDNGARDYSSSTGYNTSAESSVDTVTVPLVERIKPFHMSDNDMNKSPIVLADYVAANAAEFGRYLLQLIFDQIDAAVTAGDIAAGNEQGVNAGSVALANIQAIQSDLDSAGAPLDRALVMNSSVNSALMPSSIETFGPNVLQGGRFGNLYGMNTHVTTVCGTTVGDVHTFGASKDSIIVANRIPDVQGAATLEEYTPFTIDGIGLQCAYRRYYDASKGEHFAAFTSIYGVAVAKPEHISVISKAS